MVDEIRYCRACIACAGSLVEKDPVVCPVNHNVVYRVSIAPGCYVNHVPSYRHCSNCQNFRTSGGVERCRRHVQFPTAEQRDKYTSCDKFSARRSATAEAYAYEKARADIMETTVGKLREDLESLSRVEQIPPDLRSILLIRYGKGAR